MILLLSGLDGRFGLVNELIAAAEQHAGESPTAVIALGDVGMFEPGLKAFFRKDGSRFSRPLHYIEGHDEDYNRLDELIRAYADVMNHLERGEIKVVDGHRFLALGGITHVDAPSSAAASLVSERDLQRSLRHPHDAVDAILTYDAPTGMDLRIKSSFRRPASGFPGGVELARRFHPRLWFFASPQQAFHAVKHGTVFHGVPPATEGYGLLWPDLRYEFIPHQAAGAGGLLGRLLRRSVRG